VDIVGNRAYVACSSADSLVIIDITNPALPTLLGNLVGDGAPEFLDRATDVQVVGNYAFVTVDLWDKVLNVIDVSNPAAPFSAARIAADARALHIVGNYAYVAEGGNDKLSIFDISIPLAPVLKGSVAGAGAPPWLDNVRDVYVVGDYAYCSVRDDNCMTVINVSDPTNPTWVASIHHLDVPGCNLTTPWGIKVLGDYAYVCGYGAPRALTIIDISDPTTPTFVSSTYVASGPAGLFVKEVPFLIPAVGGSLGIAELLT